MIPHSCLTSAEISLALYAISHSKRIRISAAVLARVYNSPARGQSETDRKSEIRLWPEEIEFTNLKPFNPFIAAQGIIAVPLATVRFSRFLLLNIPAINYNTPVCMYTGGAFFRGSRPSTLTILSDVG